MIVFHQRRDEKKPQNAPICSRGPPFPCEGGGTGASDCILVQTCDIIVSCSALLQNKDLGRIKTSLFSAKTQLHTVQFFFDSSFCVRPVFQKLQCRRGDQRDESILYAIKKPSTPFYHLLMLLRYLCMHATNKAQ